jgi:ketosteroid isomerase-like protein
VRSLKSAIGSVFESVFALIANLRSYDASRLASMAEGSHAARIRAGIEAFNQGDVEGVVSVLREDVVWKRIEGLPGEGAFVYGREAVREFLQPEIFEDMTLEPLEIVEEGDVVLLRGRVRARGAASGVELEVESYVVYLLRDGLAYRVETYRDRDDAERSAGLRFA